jgi:hypothetical protein
MQPILTPGQMDEALEIDTTFAPPGA